MPLSHHARLARVSIEMLDVIGRSRTRPRTAAVPTRGSTSSCRHYWLRLSGQPTELGGTRAAWRRAWAELMQRLGTRVCRSRR